VLEDDALGGGGLARSGRVSFSKLRWFGRDHYAKARGKEIARAPALRDSGSVAGAAFSSCARIMTAIAIVRLRQGRARGARLGAHRVDSIYHSDSVYAA